MSSVRENTGADGTTCSDGATEWDYHGQSHNIHTFPGCFMSVVRGKLQHVRESQFHQELPCSDPPFWGRVPRKRLRRVFPVQGSIQDWVRGPDPVEAQFQR